MASPAVLFGMIILLSALIAVSFALRSASESGKIKAAPSAKTKAIAEGADQYGGGVDEMPNTEEGEKASQAAEERNKRESDAPRTVMETGEETVDEQLVDGEPMGGEQDQVASTE